jgi:hypothetical protein
MTSQTAVNSFTAHNPKFYGGWGRENFSAQDQTTVCLLYRLAGEACTAVGDCIVAKNEGFVNFQF